MTVKCTKNATSYKGDTFVAGEVYPACPVFGGYQVSIRQCDWEYTTRWDISVFLDEDFHDHFVEVKE